MSNFEGIQKGGRTFRPQGQPRVTFEKANQPVLDTDKAPDAGHRGERELGVTVDRIDRDGQARYLAGKISRVYRQIVSDGADLENLSREQRRNLRDQLIQGVYDGDGQHPSGEAGSTSQTNTLAYITSVANVLFGLADEIPGTPTFLTRSEGGTLVKSYGTGVTLFVPILRKDATLREVHGVIAEETPDKANEIFDYASSEPYFRKWSADALERTTAAGLPASFGNVRSQHSANAVGKLTSIEFDSANKRIPVVAKIVDDDTWRKIQAGVLTGFSIGGSYLNKWGDGQYTRYTAKPAEVSIVDNPCMPGATFSMVKDAPANPELAALKKQLGELTEKIRMIIARRAGVVSSGSNGSGSRFVNKGAGNDPKQLLKHALDNGVAVPFSGADPRSEGERASGSGRRFQPRG